MTKLLRGFSLIEMLVVIAIISIVGFLTIPSLLSVMRGSELTEGAQMVLSEMELDRQAALAQNRFIEVRFYRVAMAGMPGETVGNPATGKYRAMQSFAFDTSGHATAISKIRWLPGSIIMDSNNTLSTLLAGPQLKTWTALDPQVPLPGVGTAYVACAFQFQPNGSTNLTPVIGQQWYVTIHDGLKGDNLASLPSNFFTFQIDPLNGHVQNYRP